MGKPHNRRSPRPWRATHLGQGSPSHLQQPRPWILDCSVLELFAGTGTLSLECLSRGAASAVCVEKSSKHASYIRRNTKALETNIEIRVQCALRSVKQLAEANRTFDFI